MPKVNRKNIPNVISGGIATPLGNNMYLMIGRTHEQGGIDIGNTKNGLEVENGEVLKTNKKSVKVFSAKPILNGNSPAELVIKGINPENVFNAQERFKNRNHLKDDGTKAQIGTKAAIINTGGIISGQQRNFNAALNNYNQAVANKNKQIQEELDKYAVKVTYKDAMNKEANKYYIPYDEKDEIRFTSGRYNTGRVSKKVLNAIYDGAIEAGANPLEILALAGRESTFGIGRGYKRGRGITATDLMSNWQQVQPEIIPEKLSQAYNRVVSKIKDTGYASLSDADKIIISKYKDADAKATASTRPITENSIVNAAKFYMSGKYNPGDKDYYNKITKEMETLKADKAFMNWYNSRAIKAFGGLSRKQDYGSKKKPYPNVSSSDFAGSNRSYPIPTKADAVDALRLAGLHGRNDVKAKVYAKYPSLRKAELGTRIEDMQIENTNLKPAIITALSPSTIAAMNYTVNLMKDIKEQREKDNKRKTTKEEIIKLDTSVPKIINYKRKADLGGRYPYGNILMGVYRGNLNNIPSPIYTKYTIDDKGNAKAYPNQIDIKPLQVINGQLVPTNGKIPNLQKLPTDVLSTKSTIIGGNTTKPVLPTDIAHQNYQIADNGLIPRLTRLDNPETTRNVGLLRRNLNLENIPTLDSLPTGNLAVPKSQGTIIGFNGYNVGDAAKAAVTASKVKSTNPSTGRQPKTASGSGSGWFIGSDLIRGAVDIAGSIASYKINKDMIDKMKVNNYVPYQRYKLKTNYNINPQLDFAREQVNTMIDESKHNTASSRTDLARRQQYRNLGIRNTNELYGQKENVETQLINQDILNAQRTSQQNTRLVNDYLRRQTEMNNKLAELRAENDVSLVQNVAGTVGDYYDRRETRNREALDRAVIAASNPNAVSYMDNELPKLARQFGYRPLSFNFGRFRKNK